MLSVFLVYKRRGPPEDEFSNKRGFLGLQWLREGCIPERNRENRLVRLLNVKRGILMA
jgi:hypothetical protein